MATPAGHQVDGWLLAAGTGFLGSYTRFSTFTWQTMRLVEDGAFLAASLKVVASLATGAGAAAGVSRPARCGKGFDGH